MASRTTKGTGDGKPKARREPKPYEREDFDVAREAERGRLRGRRKLLDAIIDANKAKAIGGDFRAGKLVLDAIRSESWVSDAVRRLDGLDAPAKQDVNVKAGIGIADVSEAVQPADARQLVRELFGPDVVPADARAAAAEGGEDPRRPDEAREGIPTR